MTKRHCREWDARNVMACPTHTNLNIDCRRPFVGGMGARISLSSSVSNSTTGMHVLSLRARYKKSGTAIGHRNNYRLRRVLVRSLRLWNACSWLFLCVMKSKPMPSLLPTWDKTRVISANLTIFSNPFLQVSHKVQPNNPGRWCKIRMAV